MCDNMIDYLYFLIIIFLAFITGAVVKIADYLEDTKKEKRKSFLISLGIVYGLLIFLMCYYFPIIAPIWLGTVLGLILFGKIDKLSHRIATVLSILLTLLLIPQVVGFLLVVFIIINMLEELVNDYFDEHKIKNYGLQKIATSRPLLEISGFIASLLLWKWEIFIAILFFDIAYLIISKYERGYLYSPKKRRK